MKIFFSYGRDKNREIVEKIKVGLEAINDDDGNQEFNIWIDHREIEPNNDWRREIYDGVQSAQWAIGFFSAHALRKGGPCLDELQIAMNDKKGALSTILLEKGVEGNIPASVASLQWFDMSDWREIKENSPEQFESWFQEKLERIVLALRDPKNHAFSGEIDFLRQVISPIETTALIGELTNNFVGRTWLRDKLESWRLDNKSSSIFWITGDAGTGKSAFSAWLTHFAGVNVVSLSLCRQDVATTIETDKIIKSICFQIAARLSDYRAWLLRFLGCRMVQSKKGMEFVLDENSINIAREKLASLNNNQSIGDKKGNGALFHQLIIEGLNNHTDGGRSQDPYLIIIDGLDEAIIDNKCEIAEIIAAQGKSLPPWIALVLTSRKNEEIKAALWDFEPYEIAADSPENLEDLSSMIDEWFLDERFNANNRDELKAKIMAAAKGNFLYVAMLREAWEKGFIDLVGDVLPPNLAKLYYRWFNQLYDKDYGKYEPAIALVLASSQPIPQNNLMAALGLNKKEFWQLCDGFASLFRDYGKGFTTFHKSLHDWLISDYSKKYNIDYAKARISLFEYAWAEFVKWSSKPDEKRGVLDYYLIRELPNLILDADEDGLAGKVPSEVYEKIRHLVFSIPKILAITYQWDLVMNWWNACLKMAQSTDHKFAIADQAYVYHEIGEVIQNQGNLEAAMRNYQSSSAIRQKLMQSDENNADWQRDVSVSFDRIGDIYAAHGNLEAAMCNYQSSLSIRTKLVQSNESNAICQRDVALSFIRVGDIDAVRGNHKAAMRNYQSSLVIAQKLVQSDESNADWQRDVSISFGRIGDIEIARGNLEAAMRNYQSSLVITQKLAQSDENNAGWQRDVSISLGRIGYIEKARGNLEAAMRNYQSSLAISQKMVLSDESNAEWQRDVSISFDRIGDIEAARGNLEAAMCNYQSSLSIRQKLVQSDESNAEWQRDVSISFDKIGDIEMVRGNLEAAMRNYQSSLAIKQKLVQSDENNAGWQRDVSVSFNNIGDIDAARGNHKAAMRNYQLSSVIRQKLAQSDESNADWQCDVSLSFIKIGDIEKLRGNHEAAMRNYQLSLAKSQKLAQSDESNADWQRDVSISFDRIGNIEAARGNHEAAMRNYQSSLVIKQKLLQSDESNAGWQRDVSVSFINIGDIEKSRGNHKAAMRNYQSSLAISQKLLHSDESNAIWQRDVSFLFGVIGDIEAACGNHEAAIRNFQSSLVIAQKLAQSDESNAEWQRDLIVIYAKFAFIANDCQSWQKVLGQILNMKANGIFAPKDEPMYDFVKQKVNELCGGDE